VKRITRAENPFPHPPFRPHPEGYRDVHMVGVAYKWEHPLELPLAPGSLRRQCHGNRLPRCPFAEIAQEGESWHI
jgi:hypothetical protein